MQQNIASKAATIIAITALSLGLTACGKNDDQTAGQKLDSAISKSEQAAADAQRKAEQAAADAKMKAEQAADNASAKIEQGANKAEAAGKEAVADAKVAMADAKVAVDDAAITASVKASLAKDPDLSALKINVDTNNGAVTLTGPAPSQTAHDRATTIAQGVSGVKTVTNKLVVGQK